MSETAEYQVTGMTCGHCVSSVTEEVSEIEGVSAVDVTLNSGGISGLKVVSDQAVPMREVHAAVREAGYELTGLSS